MPPIYLNGRFVTQALTGVQRFAGEIVAALDRSWSEPDAPLLLVPETPKSVPSYRHIRVKRVGRFSGHAWEQLELPRHARDGVLINLANAAPAFAGSQLLVLHDAAVFAHPEAYSPVYRTIHKTLERILTLSRTRFATVSNFSRAEIAKYLHISADRIAVIPEGCDHVFRITPDYAALQGYRLRPRQYVLAVGSLAAHKNLASLGELARTLSLKKLDLVVAGGLDAAVFAQRGINLPKPAKYLGRVSDAVLRALYENALCFVFPSRYEGFGIPPAEAMACGCPVVVASAGAVVETCADAALYCDADNPMEIARTVGRVIDETALANALRERGRRRARELTWDKGAAALLHLIAERRRDAAKLDRRPCGERA